MVYTAEPAPGRRTCTRIVADSGTVDHIGSLLADGAYALACDGDLHEGRRQFDAAYREADLLGLSFRTSRRSDLLMGLLWQTVDVFLDGDPHAGRRLTELRESLAQGDHLAIGYVVDAIEVMLTIRSGDLDRAEILAWACAERGRLAGDIDATGWYGAQLVAIRWYPGRLVEALPMLTELVDSPTR